MCCVKSRTHPTLPKLLMEWYVTHRIPCNYSNKNQRLKLVPWLLRGESQNEWIYANESDLKKLLH